MTNLPRTDETVAVLMCTYRGERFLARQLETIAGQTFPHWRLFVSDDGSDDGTLGILKAFGERYPSRLAGVWAGPRRGYAANFLSLTAALESDAEFYAYCDQDDEWQPEKLERALAVLRRSPSEAPVLYASRVELIDAHGKCLGYSTDYNRRKSFANALVQCPINGNTMLLNRAAFELLRAASTGGDVVAHDWWAYLLITGCGGSLVFDRQPTTRYRQHEHNVIGSNHTLRARLFRLSQLLSGDFRAWTDRNLSALREHVELLDTDSRRTFEVFERARDATCVERLIGMLQSGIYRQTRAEQMLLALAVITKRL